MYLGIDLGTSEVKVLLLASDGSVVGTAGTPFTVSRPKPRCPSKIRSTGGRHARRLFALRDKFPQEFAQIRGIGLSDRCTERCCSTPRSRAAAGDPLE